MLGKLLAWGLYRHSWGARSWWDRQPRQRIRRGWNAAEVGPTLTNFGATSAEIWAISASNAPLWAARRGRTMVTLSGNAGFSSYEHDSCTFKFGMISARSRAISERWGFGHNLAGIGQFELLSDLRGRDRPKLGCERPRVGRVQHSRPSRQKSGQRSNAGRSTSERLRPKLAKC